jgi:hypothetical protein
MHVIFIFPAKAYHFRMEVTKQLYSSLIQSFFTAMIVVNCECPDHKIIRRHYVIFLANNQTVYSFPTKAVWIVADHQKTVTSD